MTAEPTAAPKATRGEWIGLAVLTLACLVYAMDLTPGRWARLAATGTLFP